MHVVKGHQHSAYTAASIAEMSEVASQQLPFLSPDRIDLYRALIDHHVAVADDHCELGTETGGWLAMVSM